MLIDFFKGELCTVYILLVHNLRTLYTEVYLFNILKTESNLFELIHS